MLGRTSQRRPLKCRSALAASYWKLRLHSNDFSAVEVMNLGCWVVCFTPPVPSSPCELRTKIPTGVMKMLQGK